jgi:CHASE1-domain containing sensor protein
MIQEEVAIYLFLALLLIAMNTLAMCNETFRSQRLMRGSANFAVLSVISAEITLHQHLLIASGAMLALAFSSIFVGFRPFVRYLAILKDRP